MAKTPDFTEEEWAEINAALEEMNGSIVTHVDGKPVGTLDDVFGSVPQEKKVEEQVKKEVKHTDFDTVTYFQKRVNFIGNSCKDIINKLTTIFNGLTVINNKIDVLNKELGFRTKDQALKDFYRLGIKSVVPDLTPKQLYSLRQLGWSIQEMAALSGYSPEQVMNKINSFSNHLQKGGHNNGR